MGEAKTPTAELSAPGEIVFNYFLKNDGNSVFLNHKKWEAGLLVG